MPIIRVDGTVTQINVFTVEPDQQQPLIEHLARAARVAAEVPGWLSASLHRSLDGTRVVNYAQSTDLDAAHRVIEHLLAKGMIQANKAFGQANPGLYEVTLTLDRDTLRR
ncbi:antibiotic biosynthesis monooxygenase [Nocardia concava]|uniref:antibiotic biosynthesis monooxygenase n=1 Tax=Nocardia concava TaxID=257281 RepID=UPI0002DE0BD7|nr:antibiotic biosynthesis monooxygenase [Nocardia concava]